VPLLCGLYCSLAFFN
jgi:hypothetical protein